MVIYQQDANVSLKIESIEVEADPSVFHETQDIMTLKRFCSNDEFISEVYKMIDTGRNDEAILRGIRLFTALMCQNDQLNLEQQSSEFSQLLQNKMLEMSP